MPEVGQTININPINLQEDVAVGVTLPFNGNAVFNSSFTTQDQVKSNLINVLLTEKGERIYEPTFGVGLRSLLFEQHIKESELEDSIKQQIDLYIPEIEVMNVEIELTPEDHTLYIRLYYQFLLDNTTDSIQLNFK